MDPLNNPTPTPNPVSPTPNPVPPTPEPTPALEPMPEPVAPAPDLGPVSPVPAEPSPVPPVPAPEPVNPPVPPVSPVPEPVNPVINPSGVPSANPMFQPDVSGIAATDPIMTAEPPKAPDPIEEELKAPMKAAEPVPGSIGSAVSGPMGNAMFNAPEDRVQSVPFNDPVMNADNGMSAMKPAKKATNKKTLIILIAIAAVVIIALGVVLVMQFMGGSTNSNPPASNQSNSSNTNNQTNSDLKTLSCTRNMTESEIVLINDAISGTVNISAEFDDDILTQVSLVKSVIFKDEGTSKNEPVETEVHEAMAEDLTTEGAGIYYLPTDRYGVVNDLKSIQDKYESLDFTCNLL